MIYLVGFNACNQTFILQCSHLEFLILIPLLSHWSMSAGCLLRRTHEWYIFYILLCKSGICFYCLHMNDNWLGTEFLLCPSFHPKLIIIPPYCLAFRNAEVKPKSNPKLPPFVISLNLRALQYFPFIVKKNLFSRPGYIMIYNSFTNFPWNSLIFYPIIFQLRKSFPIGYVNVISAHLIVIIVNILAMPSFPSSHLSPGWGNPCLCSGLTPFSFSASV